MTCCGLSRRSPPSLVPSKGASMGEGHDLSVGGDVLQRVTRCAQAAIGGYGCHPAATVRLLNVSENATYLVDDPDSGQSILRVHRLGYHSEAEIESELAWMDALRAEAGVRTPRVLPAADGRRVVTTTDPSTGEQRHGVGVGPAESEVLGRLDSTVRDRLASFGTEPHRYGLVHADTRLANLLVDDADADGGVSVIDFDDCGFSWYLYDVGTAVSFFEHQPQVPALVDSWLSGYRRAATLPARDEAEIWTFILFRRLLLVAWIGSHTAVDIARELGAGYTRDSCDLAERYLGRYA